MQLETTYELYIFIYYFYFIMYNVITIFCFKRERGWRYHIVHRYWLSRLNGSYEQYLGDYEKGIYNVFDVRSWKKVARQLIIDYNKIERHRDNH